MTNKTPELNDKFRFCPACGTKVHFLTGYVIKDFKTADASIRKYDMYGKADRVYLSDLVELFPEQDCVVKICPNCFQRCFFDHGELVYPLPRPVMANEDMPKKIKKIFNEAQAIAFQSPRAACALLRVCAEKLVNHIGEAEFGEEFTKKNRTLYQRINRVSIPQKLKDMFHACRVAGNENAHPGTIELSDNETFDVAVDLSKLINLLVTFTLEADRIIGGIEAKFPQKH